MPKKKLTLDFIRQEFEKEGYILLLKNYINSYQKLDYICPKGHKHFITWNSWRNGRRCFYCFGSIKPTIKFIRQEFENENYRLLTIKYKNAHQKLDYICPKGHKHNVNWTNWQQGHRCFYCFGNVKPTINFIKKEFKKENYVLLSTEYINSRQLLKCICSNGHRYAISWNKWQQNRRCPKCHFIRVSGSGNSRWNGGISCEPYCDIWLDKDFKQSIKNRDGNRCLNPDCWNTSNILDIHHIDYNKKNCEPQNLITLCRSCNSRANKDREWHKFWYKAILYRRYYEKNSE